MKTFKNRFLRNQKANDFETWYKASGTRVLPIFLYEDFELNLTIFTKGSNLFPNVSAWVKAYITLSAIVFFQVCSNSGYPQHSGERRRTLLTNAQADSSFHWTQVPFCCFYVAADQIVYVRHNKAGTKTRMPGSYIIAFVVGQHLNNSCC